MVIVHGMFPILIVEELLDKLVGAHFFSQIDLCSRYHQVRINPTDVKKTVFQIHKGITNPLGCRMLHQHSKPL